MSKPTTNRAAIWVAPSQLEVQDHPLPDLGPEEVLVEVVSTGICGSDFHNWLHGGVASNKILSPLILGHESAGRIIAVGSNVTTKAAGDRVAIEPAFPCYKCDYCKSGQPNVCTTLRYCSIAPTHGTLSQYYVADEARCVAMPEHISWEEAGCVQPLAVAVQLGRRAQMRAHQTVAIFGCGPLGLLCMAVAKAYGVSKIIVFDISPARVEFAKNYAADIGVVPPKNTEGKEALAFATEFVEGVLKEHGLGNGVDLAIEASGAEACVPMGVAITKSQGTYIQAGLLKPLVSVPMLMVTSKELTIKGTVRYTPGCFEDAIDLLARGAVNLKPLVTKTFPLTKSQDAFMAQKEGKEIKIVIMNQE